MPQHSTKTLKFKGKNIKYKNIVELSKKLKISREQAKKLQKDFKDNNTTRFLTNNTGDIIKYDTTKKPLILQEFLETQGIQRIRNKRFLDLDIQGWEVQENIASSTPLALTIKGQAEIGFSPPNMDIKSFSFQVDTSPDNINADMIIPYIEALFQLEYTGEEDPNIIIIGYSVVSTFSNQSINIVNMELREQNPLKLTSLYNDIVYNNTNGNCIQHYLKDIHPKISTKHQKQLKTTNDMLEYSKKYGVRMIAYDITGKVISENYEVKKKGRYKNINFIAHNNHLYPLRNIKLEKVVPKNNYNNIFTDNIIGEFEILLNKKCIYPKNVYLDSGFDITQFSYIDENKDYYTYINNPDYEDCKRILGEFGLKDQIQNSTNYKNISKIIETLYIKSNIDSFLPDNKHFIKSAFNYNNEEMLKLNELEDIEYTIETQDKNKCYSYSLRQLLFLIKVDIKHMKWKLYDNEDIVEHNLYIVSPQFSTILLPNDNIYSGEHILYCKKEGLRFNIIEVLEGEKHDNYYKQMINDLVRISPNNFKNIINIMIGKFERSTEILVNRKFEEIVNNDQEKTKDGHYMDLPFDSEYKLKYNFDKDYNVLNRKPIAIQIKDKSRVILYEQMKLQKLDTKDIIQVKTDSFTYINRGQDYSKYINKEIDGWKLETYKQIKNVKPIKKLRTFKYENRPNMNRFYDCYAGCGKSFYIQHEVNNLYINKNDTDYVILTPSHSTLKDYKKKGYNCNVIQKNTYFNTLPIENNIYIDEMGMCDNRAWNFLYMCFLANKNISAFGDFKQLLPPIDKVLFTRENFINKIFMNKLNFDSNFRNNFTKDYYDKLINSTDREWLLNEVKKYNSNNYYEADIIIAYRNKTRHKMNLAMLKKLGYGSKYDIGVKIIAKDNKLSKKNIFNKFEYIIKSVKGDNIIITDDLEDIEINKKDYDSHFDLGYCRTLYSVQGDSLKSFYYCKDDFYFLDNREVYTLISRLKQELLSIPKNYPNYDFIKNNTIINKEKLNRQFLTTKTKLKKRKIIKTDYSTLSYSEIKKLFNNGNIDNNEYNKILEEKMNKANIQKCL